MHCLLLPSLHLHPPPSLFPFELGETLTSIAHFIRCRCSEVVPTLTPADFEKHLREVLDEISKIPKVFVNLVLAGNLSGVSG